MATKRKSIYISSAIVVGFLICCFSYRYAGIALMCYRIHHNFDSIHVVPQLNVETDVCKEDGLEFQWKKIKGIKFPIPKDAIVVEGYEDNGDAENLETSVESDDNGDGDELLAIAYNIGECRLEYRFYNASSNVLEAYSMCLDTMKVDANDCSWSMPKAQWKEFCARFARRVIMGTSICAYLDIGFCDWRMILTESPIQLGMFFDLGVVSPKGDLLRLMWFSTTNRSDETRKRYDRGFLLEIAERYIRNRQEVGKVSQ